MKITFVIPPCFTPGLAPAERSAGCTRIVYPFPNIYELTAAAVLEAEGYEVALADFVYQVHTEAQFAAWAKADHSDVYAFWGVNLSIPDDCRAISILHGFHPEARFVMLGPSGTYFPDKLLLPTRPAEVIIVRGEPETTLTLLMAALRDGKDYTSLRGITYLDAEGKVVRNPAQPLIKDVDALPFPARHLLGDRQYHNPKLKTGPYTTMLTSRNCPFHCIFCVPSSLTFARELDFRHDNGRKPPIGFRSVESVERELEQLAKQGYKAIGFVDDNFIWNEERTLALCAALKKHGMVWGCQARADAITEPIAKALAESGCLYVDLGVESFDPKALEYVHKGMTVEQIYSAIEILKKYGVPVKLNILIGTSPFETEESINNTITKAKELDVDQVMINIVSPFPGTEFYERAIANGWIEGGEYRPTNVQRESILNYPHLSSRQMERLLFKNNLRFFLSPRFVWKHLRRFRSLGEFWAAAKALRHKLFG